MNEETDFSKYGKSFQETLAHIIFEDRPFSDQIEEVLDISFFELKYLRVFVDRIFDYKRKYQVHPSSEAMTRTRQPKNKFVITLLKSPL